MSTQIIVTNDNVALIANLTINGDAVNIPPTATITAALVSTDHQTAYTATITQSVAATGADWTAGAVAIEMLPAATAAITHQGPALIEIQVDDGAKRTWFVPVKIVKGQIA